jgi:type III secretion protein C
MDDNELSLPGSRMACPPCLAQLAFAMNSKRERRVMRKVLAGLAFILGLMLPIILGSQRAAAEPPWPAGAYNYIVVDQDLREVLQQFSANTGLKLALSDKVQGRVHGPLPSMLPRQFLDNLAQQFGLEWVYDGSIISISLASEARTEMLGLRDVSFDALRDGLSSAGLLDPRYQFRPIMGGHAALVSGPPRYISLVHDGLAAIPALSQPTTVPSRPAPPSPIAPSRSVTLMRGAVSSVAEFK